MPPHDMEVRITGKVGNRGLLEDTLRAQGLSLAPPRQALPPKDSPPRTPPPPAMTGVNGAAIHPQQLFPPPPLTVTTSPHKAERPAPLTFLTPSPKTEQPAPLLTAGTTTTISPHKVVKIEQPAPLLTAGTTISPHKVVQVVEQPVGTTISPHKVVKVVEQPAGTTISPHKVVQVVEQPVIGSTISPHKVVKVVEQPVGTTISPHKVVKVVEQPGGGYATLEAVGAPVSSPGAFNGVATAGGMRPVMVTRAAPQRDARQQPVRVLLVLTRQDGQQQSPEKRGWQRVNGQYTPTEYTAQGGGSYYTAAPGASYTPLSPPAPSAQRGSDGFNPFATPFVPQTSFDAPGLPLVPVTA